jgi:hypothetical protein
MEEELEHEVKSLQTRLRNARNLIKALTVRPVQVVLEVET